MISTLSFGEEIDENGGVERGDSSGKAGAPEKVGVTWSQWQAKGYKERAEEHIAITTMPQTVAVSLITKAAARESYARPGFGATET